MANEITVTVDVGVVNGLLVDRFNERYLLNQSTAAGPRPGYMSVSTTEAVIDTTGITPGLAVLKNIGSNDILIGIVVTGTFYPVILLKPGASVLVYYSSNALYAKTNTGTGALQARVYAA